MTPQSPEIPRFEAPEPSRMQRLSMAAAGRLLGAGKNADPLVTTELLVTQVGGYQEVKPKVPGLESPAKYTHNDARPVPVAAAQDETTKKSYTMAYSTASEFDDARGKHLESAMASTVSRQRATGKKAGTLRGKAARRLVGHATKGVGLSAHKS